jgi:uncharacterized protein
MNVSARLREFHRRFISLKGDPGPIAMGMALGIFIGVTPTIPFHTILIVVLGLAMRQNITSAVLGSFLISNPVTIPLFYVLEYKLGRLLLGHGPLPFAITQYSLWDLAEMGDHVLVPLLAGGLIVATLIAFPAYFVTHRTIRALRHRQKHAP